MTVISFSGKLPHALPFYQPSSEKVLKTEHGTRNYTKSLSKLSGADACATNPQEFKQFKLPQRWVCRRLDGFLISAPRQPNLGLFSQREFSLVLSSLEMQNHPLASLNYSILLVV